MSNAVKRVIQVKTGDQPSLLSRFLGRNWFSSRRPFFHKEVRWLSVGRMLSRSYGLREEIIRF
jgi:hypothetical protein